MKSPFPRTAVKKKREGEPRRTGDRVRLRGEAYEALRRKKAEEAKNHCQTCGIFAPINAIPFWSEIDKQMLYPGELSHKRHGSNKTDTLKGCIWECKACHRARHNAGGKPVARKPGRTMNQKEALVNWKATVCWCGCENKRAESSFGSQCLAKLPPQLQYDVLNATGKEYLEAMALAEQALLAWKEEKVHGT